ncbi:MAG: rhamnogalacturonan lyase [Prevotella sp.]|nr:rhamnogalacturonan lyase [Prevotella sp.]
MKQSRWFAIAAWLLSTTAQAQVTPTSQMERLDRGVVVIPSGDGEFVSWRLLGTDNEKAVAFDVLRNGVAIRKDLINATCCQDASGTANDEYQVVTKLNGEPVDTSAAVKPWKNVFYQLHLQRPANGSDGCFYAPNDCSVGDVDGDGVYELVVKWEPSNAKDNSHKGKTGNVYLDCYKMDWTMGGEGQEAQLLWRVDLGMNIRAGAHYTQFLVYDFDGDGKAEMMCKTAPGSKDGAGAFVSEAATDEAIRQTNNNVDHRNSDGYILSGGEFLTVFNGETGKAMHTIWYHPNRGFNSTGQTDDYSSAWGDSYGNRGDRFLAAVAYLDGPDALPSGIFCRGYYTRAFVWAVDFDGKRLKQKWLHDSFSPSTYHVYDATGKRNTFEAPATTSGKGNRTLNGNGNHNLSVADVDGDGCDEIVWGSAALDNNGRLLYATGLGHGDAIHLADHNPDRPGLEVFQIHESRPYGWDLHDAATGEILLSATGFGDNGRGMAAHMDKNHRGSLLLSATDHQPRSAVTGEVVSASSASMNFRIYWDGDTQEELLDGGRIEKWNGNGRTPLHINGKDPYEYNNSRSCNFTKKNPNLQADLLGDWREELILWDGADRATLNVFSTIEPTQVRVPTLMHDHVYRMGVAWQNTAYNQPPHLGYYLPDRYAAGTLPQKP